MFKKLNSFFLVFLLIFISILVLPNVEAKSKIAKKKLSVSFIDVGQGDSELIQTPNGKVILIDAGTNKTGINVINYLKRQHIEKIDVLIATHPHEDHIGGMDTVINEFNIGKIYMPKVSTNTKTFRDVLIAIKNKGLKITAPKSGDCINLDNSLKIQILAPNSSKYEDLNNYSIVIKLIYNNNSFLFCGDAEAKSEKEILEKGYNLKADVLKVGHHGSNSSSCAQFLIKVKPKYAIISCGKNNDYGHPHKVTLNKLLKLNAKILRTDLLGTIVLTSDGNTLVTFKQ